MSETVDSLKQRLVGALVILSLAIIFLPMIFDKPHLEDRNVIVPVPDKPDFQTFEINKPTRPTYQMVEVDPKDNKVKKLVPVESVASKTVRPSTGSASKLPKPSKLVQAVKSKPVASRSKATAEKRPTPQVSHLPVFKNVWMVQLGTFTNAKNAYRLRDQLRSDGFDGHTKNVKMNGKSAVRVLTGPFVNRREALKIKKRLDDKYKVESRILFFDA
jgi:DedD protein